MVARVFMNQGFALKYANGKPSWQTAYNQTFTKKQVFGRRK